MPNFTYLLSLLIRICFVTAYQKYVLPDLLLACFYLDIQPGLSLYCVIMNTLICSSVGKHFLLRVLTLWGTFWNAVTPNLKQNVMLRK